MKLHSFFLAVFLSSTTLYAADPGSIVEHGIFVESSSASDSRCTAWVVSQGGSGGTSICGTSVTWGIGATANYALERPGTGFLNHNASTVGTDVGHRFEYGASCPMGTELNVGTSECEPIPTCPVVTGNIIKTYADAALGFLPPANVCAEGCTTNLFFSSFDDSDNSVLAVYRQSANECSGDPDSDWDEAEETDPPEEGCSQVGGLISCLTEDPAEPQDCFINEAGTKGDQVPCPNTDEEPEEKCGFVAGQYACLDTAEQDCGMVSGQYSCFARTGTGQVSATPIPQNSPDHPANGGNGNGSSNDDLYEDETDVETNGLTETERKKAMQQRGLENAQDRIAGNAGTGPVGSGGEGEGEGEGMDCSGENADTLACQDLSGLGDLTDQINEGDCLGCEAETFLDMAEGYGLGDGPDVGPALPTVCPIQDIFDTAGDDFEPFADTICDVTGGPFRVMFMLLGYIAGAFIIVKGVAA